jgi:hypothetical protein
MSAHSPAFAEAATRSSPRHAGGARRAAFNPWRALRKVEHKAGQLHAIEHSGASEWTPWIAILGLILFFVPVFVLMTVLTFAAAALAQ